MDLRFLRHAESIGNATNDYSTDIHDRLSVRGHAQAEALIGWLQELPLDFI